MTINMNISFCNYDIIDNISSNINISTHIFNSLLSSKLFKKNMFKNNNIHLTKIYTAYNINFKYLSKFNLKHLNINYPSIYNYDNILKMSMKSIHNNYEDYYTNIINFDYIINISNLNTFVLTYSNITDISPLAYLKHLQKLSLKCCLDLKQFDDLQYLYNLKELELINSNINTFIPLQNLNNLLILNLKYSVYINDFNSLNNLTSLRELNLSHTNIEDLDCISNLTNLFKLELKNCYKITNFNILSNFTNLKYLNLKETWIADINSLFPLIKLRYLNIIDCLLCVFPEYIYELQETNYKLIIDTNFN